MVRLLLARYGALAAQNPKIKMMAYAIIDVLSKALVTDADASKMKTSALDKSESLSTLSGIDTSSFNSVDLRELISDAHLVSQHVMHSDDAKIYEFSTAILSKLPVANMLSKGDIKASTKADLLSQTILNAEPIRWFTRTDALLENPDAKSKPGRSRIEALTKALVLSQTLLNADEGICAILSKAKAKAPNSEAMKVSTSTCVNGFATLVGQGLMPRASDYIELECMAMLEQGLPGKLITSSIDVCKGKTLLNKSGTEPVKSTELSDVIASGKLSNNAVLIKSKATSASLAEAYLTSLESIAGVSTNTLATLSRAILSVDEPVAEWEYPTYNNGNLKITQTYQATQSGNRLEVM